MKIGGNKGHITLIQLATKRLVDKFADKIESINISFEEHAFRMEIKVQIDPYGFTNANFDFRPDIAAHVIPRQTKGRLFGESEEWKSILDSSWWIFEAETTPRNIFKNIVKIEAYKKIKGNSYGRQAYGFILVCWDDAKLPENIEPFDEVWKFKKASDGTS